MARISDQAPGFPAGTTVTGLGWPTINAHGKVAFRGVVQGEGPFVSAIWVGVPPNMMPVVVEGDSAPGAEINEIFCNFRFLNPIVRPIVAENGSVAFRGQLKTVEASSCFGREGIWIASEAGIELVALEGEQAPGVAPGLIFDSIAKEFRYGNHGVLIRGALRDTSTGELASLGFWVGLPGALSPLLLEGDPAPDIVPAAIVEELFNGFPVLNNLGESQFFAEIDAVSGGEDLLYVGDVLDLDVLIRRGEAVPEVDGEAFFGRPEPPDLSINDQLHTSFIVPVHGAKNFASLWRGLGTARELIALSDDQVPGADEGILFHSFLEAFINGTGQVVTRARPKNDPLGLNRDGVWISPPVGQGTALQKVMRAGDVIEADGESYVMDDDGGLKTTINIQGKVAFVARVLIQSEGAVRSSVWVGDESGLELRAVERQDVDLGNCQKGILMDFNSSVFTPGAGTEDGRPAYFSDNGQLVFLGDTFRSGESSRTAILISSPNDTEFSFDVDGNGVADALTDGILALRFLFQFTGDALVGGDVVASDCTRCTAEEIEDYLSKAACLLDVDGNGQTDALTDGILILRFIFQFTGDALVGGDVVAADCTRCTAEAIAAFLLEMLP